MANIPLKRVVLCFLQKRFLNAPPSSKFLKKTTTDIEFSNINRNQSFPIQYLTKSCGLSLNSAISISKKVKLEENNLKHYDSVVSLFKSHNFSDTHITKLIKKNPFVLRSRLSSNLVPKMQFLAENGLEGSFLPKLLVANPYILNRNLDAQLMPAIALIKRFLTSHDKFLTLVQRGSWFLTYDWQKVQQNIDYLIEQGVTMNKIQDMLVFQPRCMYQDIERMRYGVEMIKSMGIMPSVCNFIHILRVILSLSEESWKKKVKILESLGWSHDDVVSTITKFPFCLACSEDNIRHSIDYFVNIVKIERKIIIRYPRILTYSIKKRLIPRFAVWKILEERNLAQRRQFIWVLPRSEKDFMKQYVTKYSVTIPGLLQIYQTSKEESMKTC